MSDLTAIAIILTTFVLGAIAVGVLARLMYKRCDDILTGAVNGVSVSVKSRWLFFFHDYMALSFAITMVLGVLAVGFVAASEVVGQNVRLVAYMCAVVASGFFFFNLMLGINWMIHFVSVLRQVEPD